MSSFLSLDRKDLIEGIAMAVVVAVLGALQQAVTGHGFDIAAYDWASIVDVAVKAGAAFISTNLLTTKDGKLLGAVQIKRAA
jgi:hypothetical protein